MVLREMASRLFRRGGNKDGGSGPTGPENQRDGAASKDGVVFRDFDHLEQVLHADARDDLDKAKSDFLLAYARQKHKLKDRGKGFNQEIRSVMGTSEAREVLSFTNKIVAYLENLRVSKEVAVSILNSLLDTKQASPNESNFLEYLKEISEFLSWIDRAKSDGKSLTLGKYSKDYFRKNFGSQTTYGSKIGRGLVRSTHSTTTSERIMNDVGQAGKVFIDSLLDAEDPRRESFTVVRGQDTTGFTPTAMPNFWLANEKTTGQIYAVYGSQEEIKSSWRPKVERTSTAGPSDYIGS